MVGTIVKEASRLASFAITISAFAPAAAQAADGGVFTSEAPSLALLGISLFVLGAALRRKRQASRARHAAAAATEARMRAEAA